jgi:hypothetical protein
VNTLEQLVDQSFWYVGATVDTNLKSLLLSQYPYESEHLIFSEAQKKETKPIPVIARAALMLRIATGIVSQLLQDSDISKDELSFVWQNYGFNNGFWTSMGPIDEFYKLWVEIEQDYSIMEPEILALANSPYVIRNGVEDLSKLSQIHRAVLWGI